MYNNSNLNKVGLAQLQSHLPTQGTSVMWLWKASSAMRKPGARRNCGASISVGDVYAHEYHILIMISAPAPVLQAASSCRGRCAFSR